jgi:hypothetical protein
VKAYAAWKSHPHSGERKAEEEPFAELERRFTKLPASHNAVRVQSLHTANTRSLGYRPVSARDVKKIEKRYDAAIARYGDTFKSDYGWAAHHLKKARPNFVDLEAAAGHAKMRAHYQMGNDNVHAGIKSMYGRLGLMMDYDGLLAGRSNAGLTDPGQNAAHTLTQIVVLVCLSPKLDDLVTGNIMRLLREEIPASFWQADRRLRRKDKAI